METILDRATSIEKLEALLKINFRCSAGRSNGDRFGEVHLINRKDYREGAVSIGTLPRHWAVGVPGLASRSLQDYVNA